MELHNLYYIILPMKPYCQTKASLTGNFCIFRIFSYNSAIFKKIRNYLVKGGFCKKAVVNRYKMVLYRLENVIKIYFERGLL